MKSSPVIIVTKNGKRLFSDTAILNDTIKAYKQAREQMGITRSIPLLILDEWTWITHLKLSKRSIAHYDEKPQIFLRRDAFKKHIGHSVSLVELLKHELIHAKLHGKEKGNEHGKEFQKLAKQYKLELK